MSRDAFVTLATAFEPVFQALLLLLAAWAARAITRYVNNKRLAGQLVTLEGYVQAAVADVYQTMVKAAKDPTKPEAGTWTDAMARDAKRAAMEKVQRVAPLILASLAAAGEDVPETLSQFIEKAVVELNARVSGTLAAPGVDPVAAPAPLAAGVAPSPMPANVAPTAASAPAR